MANRTYTVESKTFGTVKVSKKYGPDSATWAFVTADGTEIGTAFRMAGDKRWMVTATDFRGHGFPLYFDTAALLVEDYFARQREAKYEVVFTVRVEVTANTQWAARDRAWAEMRAAAEKPEAARALLMDGAEVMSVERVED